MENCGKQPQISSGFQLNAIHILIQLFEGSVEMRVTLNSNLLGPMKYLTVVFKENFGSNADYPLEEGDSVISEIRVLTLKIRGLIGKGRVLNKTIMDRGEQFKSIKSTRVPFSDTMNYMVELINSQIEIGSSSINVSNELDKFFKHLCI